MLEGSSHTQTQKQILTSLEHFHLAIPEAKHFCIVIASVNKATPLLFACLSQLGVSFVTKKFMTITSPIYLDCYKIFHMCHFTLIPKTYLFIPNIPNSQNIPIQVGKWGLTLTHSHPSHRAEHCFCRADAQMNNGLLDSCHTSNSVSMGQNSQNACGYFQSVTLGPLNTFQ